MKNEAKATHVVMTGNENTVKISTVVFFVLGLIIPFWLISLPLLWLLAFWSFKSGNGTPISKNENIRENTALINSGASKLDEIEKLKTLLDSGALTEAEFNAEKAKLLQI